MASQLCAYAPFHRSERYSPTLTVDFRKLELRSLYNFVNRFQIPVRPDSTQAELAVAVGNYFEALTVPVNEGGVIGALLHKCSADSKAARASAQHATDCTDASGGTSDEAGSHETESVVRRSVSQPSSAVKKPGRGRGFRRTSAGGRRDDSGIVHGRGRRRSAASASSSVRSSRAQVGEQVACLVQGDSAEGEQACILARIHKIHADADEFECTDEDDRSNTFAVSQENVIRLEDSSKGLEKGEQVLAVFPDTTSFYRATVNRVNRHGAVSGAWAGNGNSEHQFIIVKFKDDEDAQGLTPARRVAARHVIPMPQQWRDSAAAAAVAEVAAQDTDGDSSSDQGQLRRKRSKQQ